MAASVGVASNIDRGVGEQGEVNRLKAVQNKARPNSTKHSRVFFHFFHFSRREGLLGNRQIHGDKTSRKTCKRTSASKNIHSIQ